MFAVTDLLGPVRVQRRRVKGWRTPPGVVNVTRPCAWSNPFRVGAFLQYDGPTVVVTRHLAVELFAAYIQQKGWEARIRTELRGRDLMCWCRLDQECHADVLLAVANG